MIDGERPEVPISTLTLEVPELLPMVKRANGYVERPDNLNDNLDAVLEAANRKPGFWEFLRDIEEKNIVGDLKVRHGALLMVAVGAAVWEYKREGRDLKTLARALHRLKERRENSPQILSPLESQI